MSDKKNGRPVFRIYLNGYGRCQCVINAVSSIFNGDNTATAALGNDRDPLTRITTKRKEEGIKLLIIRLDTLDDILLAFVCFL